MLTSVFATRFAKAALMACFITPVASIPAQAQSRVAIVHFQRLLNESPLAKAADSKLFAEFKGRETAIQEDIAKLRRLNEKLSLDTFNLTERDRLIRTRELIDLQSALESKQERFRDDLNERKQQERAAIAKQAYAIIEDITVQEKLDLVLLDAMWFNPRVDITDKVLRRLVK